MRLKEYLLGILSEADDREIDLRLISNESFEAQLSLAEHNLIEDHLDGLLTVEESALFKSNFLTSPRRMELLRETSLLKELAKKRAPEPIEAPVKAAEPKKSFFKLYFRPLLAGASAFAILTFVVIWFFGPGKTRPAVETEYAELNTRDLSDTTRLTDLSTINLMSGNFRGESTQAKQNASKLTDTVLLRLALPSNASDEAIFKVRIDGPGGSRFELDKIRLYQNPNGQELRILVPKSILGQGPHQITVKSNSDDSAIAVYSLAVE